MSGLVMGRTQSSRRWTRRAGAEMDLEEGEDDE